MSNFFKKIIVFLGIVTLVSATTTLAAPTPTYAEDRTFLGMPSWDNGVSLSGEKNQDQLIADIAKIATNILTDITVLAAYLVLGYTIYGGYLYMFSSGDPTKAAAGKKTLQHAFIGLAITGSAYAIFGAIRVALIGNNNLGDCNALSGSACVEPGEVVTNLIQWFIGMAGVVSAIFIVVGGWGYITAAGDPGKLQKAKSTLLYAIIGLVIVGLSMLLTAFISNLVREANDNTNTESSSIINTNTEDNT